MKVFIVIFLTLFSLKTYALNYGGYSCGDVLKYERENNEIQISLIKMYMAGFIFANNVQHPSDKEFFENTDSETIFYLVVKYCEENPQNYLGSIAMFIWWLEVNNEQQ